MKYDAKDLTILLLVRTDSVARMENVIATVEHLHKYFQTNIYVREADKYCNRILSNMLPKKTQYEFAEDNDPILHKTWHFNQMMENIQTPLMGIWDADVIADSNAIAECINKLRTEEADLALPYNGVCLDTSEIIRMLYLKVRNEDILMRHIGKMNRLSQHILTGGAVLMNVKKFNRIGKENEAYYGWGDDDFDRYIRFMNHGMKIYRSHQVLFHLSHPRGYNSKYYCKLHQQLSKKELHRTQNELI